MNSVTSNNPSLKYRRFKLSSLKDIGVRKFKFVAKIQNSLLCSLMFIVIFKVILESRSVLPVQEFTS